MTFEVLNVINVTMELKKKEEIVLDIREEVIKIIRKNIENSELMNLQITDDTLLLEDLLFDSITFIQLIVDLEDKFCIEIDDFDIVSYDKFIDLFHHIYNLVEEKKLHER